MDMPGLGMPPGMPPIGDGMHRMASLGDFGTPPPHTLNMPNMAPLGGPFQSPFSALGLSQGLNENTLQNKGGQEDPHTPSLLFGFKQLGIGGHETNPNPSGNAIANGNVNPQRADLFGMYGLNSAYSAEQPMSRLPEFQTPTKLPPQDPLMNFLAQDPFKGSMGPDARASNSSGYVLPGAETTTPSAIKVIDESKLPPAGMPAQTPATTTKSGSQPPMRLVRNQRGTLTINLNNSRMNRKEGKDVDGFSVRPAYQMSVSWMVPSDIFFNKENENLTIALFKYGSMSNTTSVVAKSLGGLSRSTVETKDMTGQAVVRGSVPFHAPKGAGRYVFRLVDQNSDKLKSSITIATSISFVVDLLDVDVTQNFKFSVDAFRDSQIQKGLTQLLLTIPSVRNSGKNYQRDDPRHLANSCIDTLLSSISEGMQILDKARERALQDKLAKATAALNALANENTSGASGLTSTQGDNEQKDDDAAKADKEFFVSVKQTSRLHTDIHDCIGLLKKNQIVFSMLSQNLRQRIESIDKLYCRILNRYFKDAASITIARVEDLNFSPAPRSPLFRTIQEREHVSEEGMQINPATIPGARAMVQALNHSISSVLQHLYPKEDFTSQRTEARARIELILATHGVVPAGTSLLLYGSSCNNFGTDGADMDMCLAFPAGYTVEQDDKALLLERIADALEKGGMRDVRSRATARIPIVNFEDPQSGLECDIGFYNPLALCNTRLLRTYTMADKRLRPLAYVIKHWAKSRKINNPGEGSLGSYGYILCLIHYLQSRAVPVLPNLQRLPPNWSGQFDRNGLPPVYKNESEVILHHLDGTPCKTYFYAPNEGASANPLEVFGSRNQESVGELLAGFFQYFAWEFDYRSNIVSIQAFPDQVLKSQKIEIDAWTKHERLSIEDPFETWYDVAHIIKGAQMAYIRKEFLRAHTLIQRACATSSPLEPGDELPQAVDPAQLLNILCEPGPVPPYSEQVKLARLAKESADAVTESDA
jgi:DNA polymerase sigma